MSTLIGMRLIYTTLFQSHLYFYIVKTKNIKLIIYLIILYNTISGIRHKEQLHHYSLFFQNPKL